MGALQHLVVSRQQREPPLVRGFRIVSLEQPRRFALVFLALAITAAAQSLAIFPLSEVKPGLHGIGRTVFSGTKVEQFDVEILGVLENVGPKQSVILARLSGGPLEKTGVLQGMSGSPVTINGRLVGAVALSFPFSKEPIAGIRPIEAMLRTSTAATPPSPTPSPEITIIMDAQDRKKAIVLGAGGAARAIVAELALAGTEDILVVNRAPVNSSKSR